MNTKILLMFAAIAAVLGTVTGALVIQPTSAQLSGSIQAEQRNDQGDCLSACSNSQSFQDGEDIQNNQENTG